MPPMPVFALGKNKEFGVFDVRGTLTKQVPSPACGDLFAIFRSRLNRLVR